MCGQADDDVNGAQTMDDTDPSNFSPSEAPLTEIAQASPAVATAPDSSLVPAEVVARLEANMMAQLVELRRAFDDKLKYDRFKEGQIDRLHDELQGHKANLLAQAIRPILRDVIRLHDDLGRMVEALRQREPAEFTREKLFKVLEGFAEDIEAVLQHNGVESVRGAAEVFDARQQKTLRTIPTADPTLVGRVAANLRPGFIHDGFALEKERVAVYVAEKPAAPTLATTEAQ